MCAGPIGLARAQEIAHLGSWELDLASSELVEKVPILTQKHAQNHRIEVTWEGGDELPPVSIVRDHVHQVFLNLVLNAIDAMPDGGTLRIQAARTAESSGVQVSFTGPGSLGRASTAQRIISSFRR
ncbi:MAG: histidine phosphotransferase family protein [Anaerolineae bacterium]